MPPSAVHQKLTERQAFAERLQRSLRDSGRSTSPNALAQEFNVRFGGARVHASSCRKWLQGEAIPTQEKLVVLSHMLGVTADWLRYGESTRIMDLDVPTPYSKPELALLADFGRLPARDQDIVRQLIRQMLTHPPEA